MLDQFGTIAVRECRLTREEVERIVAENLQLRGPKSYEFDYAHPVLIWGNDGNLIVRWPSRVVREEPNRSPRPMDLMPWPEFIKQQSSELRKREEAAKGPPDPSLAAEGGQA